MEASAGDFGNLNKLIHEPARLSIMAVLSACEGTDFNYLMNTTELTKGNLSSHLSKLENAKYVKIEKRFVGKVTHTSIKITKLGNKEFRNYVKQMRGMMKNL